MSIVTVLSDWKSANSYFGTLAGVLFSSGQGINLIELTKVADHNIMEAAHILNSCIQEFPDGTIHLVMVGMTDNPGQIFIGEVNQQFVMTWTNCGFFSLLNKVGNLYQYEDDERKYKWVRAMGLCCVKLMQNSKLSDWATVTTDHKMLRFVVPIVERNSILGNVIQIDPYGNAITNIKRDLFEDIGKGREFEIYLQSNFNKITQLSEHYEPNKMGELLALFNEEGFLEIAISHGNVAQLLNVDTSSEVRIRFFQGNTTNFLK